MALKLEQPTQWAKAMWFIGSTLLMCIFMVLCMGWYWSVQFSRSVVSDSLRPHGLQHARLPCPSPTPRACSNSGQIYLMGCKMCCVGSSHHRPCNPFCFVATLSGQALEHILLAFILSSLWGKRNLPAGPSGLSSLFTGSHTRLLFFCFAGKVSSMPQS